jgi:thiamine biosynthesis lipoprotein
MRCGGSAVRDHSLKRAQYLFGTLCAIELEGSDPAMLESAIEVAFEELGRVQRIMNPFDPSSELSRLNAAAGTGPRLVSRELLEVVAAALRMSAETGGRYDATTWPLIELWRQCERERRSPTPEELRAAVSRVDYRAVHVDHAAGTVDLERTTTRLDLSSLVKGYALDRALSVLQSYPLAAALLDAGGELLAWRSDGGAVSVGLSDPRDRSRLVGVLQLTDHAVATSAQGEAHLLINGQAVGHLFDTRSGVPLDAQIESVSIIAPSGLEADLLSTALFVIEPDEGRQMLHRRPDVAGLWILRHGGSRRRLMSDGFPFEESDAWAEAFA